MKRIAPDSVLLHRLYNDTVLCSTTIGDLHERYEDISLRFHSYFFCQEQEQHQNALYHRIRYLALLSMEWSGHVLDVGNDKPFLSFFLSHLNPNTEFKTISYEIPQTPFDLFEVDIEQESFPFDDGVFDAVIFTEVIEHLWRDPSHAIHEINRVSRVGASIFLSTPNPCDKHSIVCILWQANPNQRSGYFTSLESGHLHLWTVKDIQLILGAHGYNLTRITTENLYGHTNSGSVIDDFCAQISPYVDLMGEAVVAYGVKATSSVHPTYPVEIFPDGGPVQFVGAIKAFASRS